MRCTFKTVFYVNRSKKRNGIVPIIRQVTINGTIAQFSCKQSVTKAIWDAKGNISFYSYSYEPLLAFYQVITLSTISCCSKLLLRR